MFDPTKYGIATIVEREDLTSDLWVIRVTTDFDLGYRSGQYLTLGLAVDGRIIERPYSICSSPEESQIELFIERVPGGELTVPLYELGVGAEMAVRRRCKGLFLKEAPVENQDHLFVSTVTGVAPFISMVRTLQRRAARGEWDPDHRVVLLQGASVSGEFGYMNELRALEGELAWLIYVPTVSRPWEDPEWPGEVGRVEDVVRKYTDQHDLRPGETSVFICGNPQMIGNVRGVMRRRGFDDKEVREEQYWPE